MSTTPPSMPITLLTDFGERGGYVGAMKGVIASLHPGATAIDLTHQVTPQAVREGAFLLHAHYRYFPPGTVHVAVVDPGVGTARRAIALAVPGVGCFVGPDNGLFTPILEAHRDVEARSIHNPDFTIARLGRTISATFHGRDIFAPAAALLARREPFAAIGPRLDHNELVRLDTFWADWEESGRGESRIRGEVVHVDAFGNLITNIPHGRFAALAPEQLRAAVVVAGPHRCAGLRRTYGESQTGDVTALIGSGGTLEIARVNGRADRAGRGRALGLGLPVEVRILHPGAKMYRDRGRTEAARAADRSEP